MTPQQQAEIDKKPSYIAYCPKCSKMAGCAMVTPEVAADFAKEMIANGMIIERKTVADVKAAQWCTCNDPKTDQQPTLFAEQPT